MKETINNLKSIAKTESQRSQRNINNLVERIEYFYRVGDKEKLSSCLGEAYLWGAK